MEKNLKLCEVKWGKTATYEKFLKEVTFVFTIVIVTTVPGITGLVASLILSYIFFGMFYLIEDMDNPLDYGEESLITVNLNPLEEMIDNLDIECEWL